MQNSLGIVESRTIKFNKALTLGCGYIFENFELVVETYGKLNDKKTNAILICHALSGNHHAAGFYAGDKKPGWWNNFIGPNKPIDTDKFFVVSLNNIGGCHGSTGPNSINLKTGKRYGGDFPMVTVQDWVNSQAMLADYLEIDVWAAVIGGSLGGMQAIEWSIMYPDRLKHCIAIASTSKLSAQNIAFNEIARRAIVTDSDFFSGNFVEQGVSPKKGLMLARMLGHITYLSENAFKAKFDRSLKEENLNFSKDNIEFQVESYLHYQGENFAKNFDANTYVLMTKALDYFDPASRFDCSLTKAFENVQASFLVISFTTDWRFPPHCSQEIVNALVHNHKNVSYLNIDAIQGHDAFLLNIDPYNEGVKKYLSNIQI